MPLGIVNRVSEVMGRERMSIAELARRSGLSYPTVYEIYHDRTGSIAFETLDKLCKTLEVGVEELFKYDPTYERPHRPN